MRVKLPAELTGSQRLAAFDGLRHYSNQHTHTSVAFASAAQRPEAVKLVALLDGVGWPAVLRETSLQTSGHPEPVVSVQVRGWNTHLVAEMAIALEGAGVIGVERKFLSPTLTPDYPERQLQQNNVDVWVGHSTMAGA